MIDALLSIPAFIVGIIFLWKGSDILVEGTSHTAAKLGISSIIISLIIVAFGTSAPELAISFGAALQNRADISLGNIIGSCIANIFLVIGISSIINPIKINKSIIRRELPIFVASSIILFLFSFFGLLDNYHYLGGIIFIILFIMFVFYFIQCARKERKITEKYDEGSTRKNILFILIGIIGVVIGAWLLIESAITFADILNIPAFVIALSLVAIGTSLPELVVSSMAAYKGESDIAIGNVFGSNVFNIFLILGVSALFIPLETLDSFYHLIFLLIATFIMIPAVHTGHVISRFEGFIFLILYCIYIWFIFSY